LKLIIRGQSERTRANKKRTCKKKKIHWGGGGPWGRSEARLAAKERERGGWGAFIQVQRNTPSHRARKENYLHNNFRGVGDAGDIPEGKETPKWAGEPKSDSKGDVGERA